MTDLYPGDHAGVGETSLLWAIAPELVRLGQLPAELALDGLIGPDPRHGASAARGKQLLETICARAVEMGERLLPRTSILDLDRADYIEALSAGVRVLERTLEWRQHKSRRDVPPLLTPAYSNHCQALYADDYRLAREQAEQKFGALEK